MRRTNPGLLVALVLFGAAVGFALQTTLAALSIAKLRPEYTLAVSLLLIGLLVVALAIPVRRAVRGVNRQPVDPFYATRVVLLAKACAIAGSLLAGLALGFLLDLVLRGSPASDSFLRVLASLGGSAVLLVGGVVAELLCRVPPRDDDDDHPDRGPERVHL